MFELRVSQLNPESTEEEIRAFIEKSAGVKAESVKLLVNKEGESKGVCFLKYENQAALDKALAIGEVELKGVALKVQQAESQEARRALNKERRQRNQKKREPKEGEEKEEGGEPKERRRRQRRPR